MILHYTETNLFSKLANNPFQLHLNLQNKCLALHRIVYTSITLFSIAYTNKTVDMHCCMF